MVRFKIKKRKPLTIKQLQKSIAEEEKKVKKAQGVEAKLIERSQLKKQLFQLKNKTAITSVGKGKRILQQTGRGLLKAGKTIAPIIKKQAQLIRQQQLRDEAIEKRLKSRRKTSKKITKAAIKRGQVKSQSDNGMSIFGNLDF